MTSVAEPVCSTYCNKLGHLRIDVQIKAVEIVPGKGCLEDVADLTVIIGDLQLFGSASDGKVVHEDLTLFNRALCDAAQFAEFKISEPLDTQPDARTDHSQNQSQRAPRRPEKKYAKQRKQRRNGIQQNHHLAVREAKLQQFVMNMFAVTGEHRVFADETP